MEALRFICKCGYTKEIFGDIDDIVKCELCGNLMDLDIEIENENTKTISQKELGKIIAIEGMQKNLKTLGQKKTWFLTEKLFTDPITRLRYRQLFLDAGGVIPERKLKGYV